MVEQELLKWSLCCSVFSFLCNFMSTIVCHFLYVNLQSITKGLELALDPLISLKRRKQQNILHFQRNSMEKQCTQIGLGYLAYFDPLSYSRKDNEI